MFLSMISALRFSWVTSVGVNSSAGEPKMVVLGSRSLALEQLVGDIGRRAADDLARLADGVVLVAGDDELQAGDGRVVTAHRRNGIHARGLERRDRATGGAVVRGDDPDDPGSELRDLAGHPLLGVLRLPLDGVVLAEHRHAAVVDGFVNALLDKSGGGVGWRTVDDQDARAGRQRLALDLLDQRWPKSACRSPRCRTTRSSRPSCRGSAGRTR